jgi:hypothetical protein
MRKNFALATVFGLVTLASSNVSCVNHQKEAASSESSIPISIDYSRKRNDLDQWKSWIAEYSLNHYGEKEWKLNPKSIILHYTSTSVFPNAFVNSTDPFKNEMPPTATQYVVQGSKIFEILPPTVRCRGALGANHRAISIEMIAMSEDEVLKNPDLMQATARLTAKLMRDYSIPFSEVYSHEDVDASIKSKKIPWVLDKLNEHGTGKIDPGARAMTKILAATKAILENRNQPEHLSLAGDTDMALTGDDVMKQFPLGDVEPSGE